MKFIAYLFFWILPIVIVAIVVNKHNDIRFAKIDAEIQEVKQSVEDSKVEIIDRLKRLTVTSYSASKNQCDSDPEVTASMLPVKEGTIAVSRDLFNSGWVFGRHVYIEGLGIYEIRDLMNKRYKSRIDIFRWEKKKAIKFGKKKLAVALLNI